MEHGVSEQQKSKTIIYGVGIFLAGFLLTFDYTDELQLFASICGCILAMLWAWIDFDLIEPATD